MVEQPKSPHVATCGLCYAYNYVYCMLLFNCMDRNREEVDQIMGVIFEEWQLENIED